MKILLLSLPRDGECQDNLTPKYIMVDFMNYPPLGLLAIAAGVDRRHDLEVLDSDNHRITIDQVVEYVRRGSPDILAMSVVTWRLFAMAEIARRVKEACPETTIVVGGPHPSDSLLSRNGRSSMSPPCSVPASWFSRRWRFAKS